MSAVLTSPGRLRQLFSPASVALVGASDTSTWAQNVYQSLRTAGFEGRFVPVHSRHTTAFGIATRPTLRDLDEPVDLAFALVPTQVVEDVVNDAAVAGVRNMIVLAGGFGERGGEGRLLERRLVETATAHGITLLGPNGLGFINAHARVGPYGLVLNPPLIAGPIGLVLQSGALASAVLAFVRAHALGMSLLISMGNEAMVTTSDVIDYLIEDDNTRVIGLFLEEIRQPTRFADVAQRALQAGKPIIALKVGRSPAGQRVAEAHTGAIAGDDAVADAAFRQLGVIRVRSLEEMLTTAGLLGHAPPLRGRRMGAVTASGGACGIIADRAHDEGIEIPEFAPQTVTALESVLPPFTSPRNPLDVTGYFLAHQGTASPILAALEAATRDPNLDFVLYLGIMIPPRPDPDVERGLDDAAAIIAASPIPVLPASTTCIDLSDHARDLLLERHLHVLAGLDLSLKAIGHALRWHAHADAHRGAPRALRNSPTEPPHWLAHHAVGVWPETDGRRLLSLTGVPMVDAELVCSTDEAVVAADRIGYPVALKACGPGLVHKTDIGGVALALTSPDEVRRAYLRLCAAAATVPDASVTGVLVSPMRVGGHELLAGVRLDPTFGPVLAVGLGGIWVEALNDVALRLVPVDATDVREMLGELRSAALLRGDRAATPVDLDRVADALVRLADAATLVGSSLEALEVNPLWCNGDRVEGLDVRVVTASKEA